MKKHILIIEDNDDVRENIEEILELSNYQVTSAQNGKEGVKKAKELTPDLILCDIMMPELDGYEVLYMLSKDPSTASIPFIFLTAKSEKTDFRKGMGMGADDYLTKPFDEMELLQTIENRLKKYESLSVPSENKNLDEFIDRAKESTDMHTLAMEKKMRTYSQKEHLYRDREYANHVFYITKGKVRLYKVNPDAKSLTLNILNPGDFCGFTAILKDEHYHESAEAMEETECRLIPRQDFLDLMFKNRDVASTFIKLISGNLIEKEKEMLDLAYNTVRKRTADALVKLKERFHSGKEQGPFEFTISREELASMVGTATESVIRMLSEFKRDGIIKIEGGKIVILDYDKLKKIKF